MLNRQIKILGQVVMLLFASMSISALAAAQNDNSNATAKHKDSNQKTSLAIPTQRITYPDLYHGFECRTAKETVENIYRIIDEQLTIGKKPESKADCAEILAAIGKEIPLDPAKEGSPLLSKTDEMLREDAVAAAEKKLGQDAAAYEKKLRKDSEKLYPMHKLKDYVEVYYQQGPVSYLAKGKVYFMSSTKIIVGGKTIFLIDLDEKTRSMFDPDLNKSLQDQYVESHLAVAKTTKDTYEQRYLEKKKNAQFQENQKAGYILDPATEEWITAETFATRELKRLVTVRERDRQKAQRLAAKKLKREQEAAAEAELKAQQEEQAKKAAEQQQALAAAENGDLSKMSAKERKAAKAARAAKAAAQKTPEEKIGLLSDIEDEEEEEIEEEEDASATPGSRKLVRMQRTKLSAKRIRMLTTDKMEYDKVIAKVKEKQEQISNTCFGIDADQGYKNAFFGFSLSDVRYSLSREKEFRTISGLLNRDIITLSKPKDPSVKRMILMYHGNALFKTIEETEVMSQTDFNIMKNTLHNLYGPSDEEMANKNKKDLFAEIAAGKITVSEYTETERAQIATIHGQGSKDKKNKVDETAIPLSVREDSEWGVSTGYRLHHPFRFTWNGKHVRGVLLFNYNADKKRYTGVCFSKESYDFSPTLKFELQMQQQREAAARENKGAAGAAGKMKAMQNLNQAKDARNEAVKKAAEGGK